MSVPVWGWVVLVLLALLALFLDRVALKIASPSRKPVETTPEALGAEFEEISFRVKRYTLRGWIVGDRSPGPDPVVLAVHGWADNAGAMIEPLRTVVERGHPVVFFDFRAHGRSDDAPWATVRHYWEDLQGAVAFVRERFPRRPLVLVGHSMGGAIGVIGAADGFPVDGLVCVASPADILEATRVYLDEAGLPGGVVLPLTLPFLWIRARVSFRRFVPERRISELEIPMALIHAENDRRVASDHPGRLARAAPALEVTRVPDAGHRDVLERPVTRRTIARFLERWEGDHG